MNHPSHREHFLIERLKLRDEAAISYAYDHYAASLYGAILQIVKKEAVGEELLQDVFLKIWERIDQYDENKGRFFTWMLRIARNSALDYLKTRQSKQDSHTADISTLQPAIDASYQTQTSTDAIGIERWLSELPREEQAVIQTLYLQGYSQSEAAKKLDIPLGTVKTRARSAMKQLRAKLQLL